MGSEIFITFTASKGIGEHISEIDQTFENHFHSNKSPLTIIKPKPFNLDYNS